MLNRQKLVETCVSDNFFFTKCFALLAWAVELLFVCGDIVISRDQVSITCSTKGNVHNTVCATGMHCVVHVHIKLLCVSYQ